jgi:Nif-specific regulatory protein
MEDRYSEGKMFKILLEISQTLNGILSMNELLSKVMDLAIETLNAERGFVLLSGEGGEDLKIAAARNMEKQDVKDLSQISQSVVRSVLEEKRPVLTHDATVDSRFKGAESVRLHNIVSIMCVPLGVKERILGAIYVDSTRSKGVFTDEDLEFLTIFANQSSTMIENARLHESVLDENVRLRGEVRKIYGERSIIGKSPKMVEFFDLLERVIDSDASVMLLGETGTGKELAARTVHYNGPRREKNFVPLYCGALPETLLESELFGAKKGAFTGAVRDREGLFEVAGGGTLFLDEVCDVSPPIQAKILRALQEGEFRRIGETRVRRADVRVISATNKDIRKEVREGRFREDLYYRLNVISITLPPLRDRKEDIPLLADHFLKKYADKARKSMGGFTEEAIAALLAHDYPGNVREIENMIERAVLLATSDKVTVAEITSDVGAPRERPTTTSLSEHEKTFILDVLDKMGGNRRKTAEALGLSLRALQYRLKEWGVIKRK